MLVGSRSIAFCPRAAPEVVGGGSPRGFFWFHGKARRDAADRIRRVGALDLGRCRSGARERW